MILSQAVNISFAFSLMCTMQKLLGWSFPLITCERTAPARYEKHYRIELKEKLHRNVPMFCNFIDKMFLAAMKAVPSVFVHLHGTFLLRRLFSGANTVE